MKKYLIIIVLMIPNLLNSQSSNINVTIGPAIPLGDYRVGDYETSAYAKTGGNIALSIEQKIYKFIGVKAAFTYTFNPIARDQLADYYDNWYDNYSHIIESGSYTIYSFMGGAAISIPSNKFYSIDFYGMLGYSICRDPGTRIEGAPSNGFPYHRFQSFSASTGNLCVNAGADINLKLCDRVSCCVGVSYFGTTAKFRDVGLAVEEYKTTTVSTKISKIGYDYAMMTLNANVGLRIWLGN